MNIKDLKYLVVLAKEGHFSKAAVKCFVSQPTLSMQLKKLEVLLGITLIERHKKTFFLTEAGKAIAARAELILSEVDAIHDLAKAAQDPFNTELTIGIIPTVAPYLLPDIIPRIHRSFPKLKAYLIEEQTERLLEKLKIGEIDAALLALPLHEPDLQSEKIGEEPFLLMVAKSHPLANRKTVKVANLHDEPILLLEEGHCLRDQALVFCKKARATEIENFRATSLETLRQMVASGLGVTLMPQLATRGRKDARYIPFEDPKPHRTLGLVFRKTSVKKALLQKIAASISIADLLAI